MLASEVKGKVPNKLVVDILGAQGYYYNEINNIGVVLSEDRWLLDPNERKQYIVSCRSVVQEGMININKTNPASEITATEVNTIWTQIYLEMLEDTRQNPAYDRDSHNCCTVSFESLRKFRDDSQEFLLDLSHIKKRNFNCFGHGIKIDWNELETYLRIRKI